MSKLTLVLLRNMQIFIAEAVTQVQLITIFEVVGALGVLLLERHEPKIAEKDTSQINLAIYGMTQPGCVNQNSTKSCRSASADL